MRLWELPPLTVGIGTNIFVADSVVGFDDNEVCVRLPLFYQRDSRLWRIAEVLSRAIIPVELLEIGYHEFTADYSVAGEPIFRTSDGSTPTPPPPAVPGNITFISTP
jgi:hypothetical protein